MRSDLREKTGLNTQRRRQRHDPQDTTDIPPSPSYLDPRPDPHCQQELQREEDDAALFRKNFFLTPVLFDIMNKTVKHRKHLND